MLVAPKNPVKNAIYRRELLRLCSEDDEFREEAWVKCAQDFVFWCDSFGWTLSSKDHAECPKVPFILYPFQERAARDLISAVGKEDRLIEKSRDMGATWIIIAVFVWFFLFRRDYSFLVGSRKAEFVDKTGDPKTLFYKLDFLLKNVPPWMFPPSIFKEHRILNHIYNPLNGSVIDGESTNENFGAGDRRAAVMLDEFALVVDKGYQILGAVGDVTNCCIYNSTPLGASGAYYDTRQQMARETPHRILRFHWSDHPAKRKGLYTSEDGKLKILDESYLFPDDYKFILDGRIRSVSYDTRERRAANRQIMAQQWDIDYLQSGWQFFCPIKLEATIAKHARPPLACGELLRDPDWKSPQWLEQKGGRLKLWIPVPMDGKIPAEWNDVVIGFDIASGSGGEMSSNSVASIARRTTGEKIGEFASNLINPHDFAHYGLALAKFFNDAFIIYERNGPNGAQFGKVIKDSGYRNIFFPVKETRLDTVVSKEPGWWTDEKTKPILLGGYAEALWSGEFINPSREALEECGHYVQNGERIEHSRSLAGATNDPTAVGESHGDRVVADSLAHRGCKALAVFEKDSGPPEPPPNSYGGRRRQWEREQRKGRHWGSWRRVG